MFAAERISYSQTKAFSSIVLDYIQGHPDLQPFYTALPTVNHIKEAVRVKEQQVVNRKLLVATLENQYAAIKLNPAVQSSIEKLSHDRTFTICTAHQPNLFTGPLYFVYKILHAIKLAAHLNLEMPTYHFVPVFYMGSEDADFGELNHFTVEGKRYEWNTHQTGAVGRMKVDQSLLELIEELNGQLSIHSFGKEWIEMLRSAFKKGTTIQDATFQLVDRLFGDYGLVVLIADVPALKKTMSTIFHQDLFEHAPAKMVQKTNALLNQQYEAQAHVRDINLFYLKDAIRERIERAGEGFVVCNTDIRFSSEELTAELEQYPERFSPNVILRGIYQESILPDVAFIGGGGEIAYWLQFKELFEHYKLQKLENKMLRAEKRKFDDTRKQIAFLKASLFPKNGLQERVENIGYYYAKFGKGIIDAFYQHSLATEQEFTILKHVSG